MGPQKIGQFTIVSELAKTADGAVYKATDPKGRTVALRTLRLGPEAAPTVAGFRTAAQAASVLRSPNIASVFGGGEADGVFFVVVEFVEGVKLSSDLAKGQPTSMSGILDLSRQVCYALDHAQSKGIIHAELKPSNIIVEWDGTAKIMDFGVPHKHAAGELTEATYYLSPEEVRGEPLDPRSNLFSWAAILYQMATGKKAFDAEDAETLRHKILEEMPVPAHEVSRNLPPRVSEILRKALAKAPGERHASAGAFLTALEEYRKGESAPPKPVAAPASPRPTPAAATPRPAPATVAPPTPRPAPAAAPAPARPAAVAAAPAIPRATPAAAAPAKAAASSPAAPEKPKPAPAPLPVTEASPVAEARAAAPQPAAPPAAVKAATAATGRPNFLLYGMGGVILLLVGIVVVMWMRSGTANPTTAQVAATGPATSSPAPAETGAQTPATTPAAGAPRTARKKEQPVAAPAAPVTGDLRVDSIPPGAEVQIDGRHEPAWTTPFTATGLAVGAHTVIATKPGYTTVNRSAAVTAGQSATVAVQLTELAATITVSSDPAGASISLDGKDSGQVTPAKLVVAKGSHTIAVHKTGYLDASSSLELAPGQNAQFSPALKQTGSTENIKTVGKLGGMFGNAPENSGRVSVKTNPKGAQVTINGQSLKKTTPVDFYLSPGSYEITLTMDGYKPLKKVVDIQKGGKLVVDETLAH